MKTNLALIGFMGVGKSAAGRALAEELKKRFVETDAVIKKKAGKSISRIFEEEGEIAFREMEIEAIKEIASGEDQVIACGGGVVLNKINIDRLRKGALIVWLTASPGEVRKRLSRDQEERPLLKGRNSLAEIRRMITDRKPYYESAANIKVDTSRLDIDLVVGQVLEKIKNENFH